MTSFQLLLMCEMFFTLCCSADMGDCSTGSTSQKQFVLNIRLLSSRSRTMCCVSHGVVTAVFTWKHVVIVEDCQSYVNVEINTNDVER